jgi:rRNA-processing protein FCF1
MILKERLFEQYAGKSVLLDSNLLLVFLSGSLDPRLFGRFKRVSSYSLKDYDLLVRVLSFFTVLLTTPHILTEVGNLANSLPGWIKPDWHQNIATLISSQQKTPGLRERWTPAVELAQRPEFAAFGITDAALAELALDALIVTEDYRLSGFLRSKGVPVLNFNDFRKLQKRL